MADTNADPKFRSVDDYAEFANYVMRKSRNVRDEKNEHFLRRSSKQAANGAHGSRLAASFGGLN